MHTQLTSLLVATSLFLTVRSTEEINWNKVINTVNSKNGISWKAGFNFPKNTPISYLKGLQGTILNLKKNKEISRPSFLDEISEDEIPEEFDARVQWPNCNNTINHIRDQGACGSCWAVATASAFTDELCVANKLADGEQIASEDVLACTFFGGCYGGVLDLAWFHIKHTGCVTGGDYNSHQGCLPYSLESCEHHANGSRPQCTKASAYTPGCPRECSNMKYSVPFKKDLYRAKDYYEINGEKDTQKAILRNGPVVTGFDVYTDFVTYKSGVYYHITGNRIGGHAVRIIGWGTENKTPYWLVANSWNTDWGDKGFFKILRGNDECGFESTVLGGLI